MALLAGESRDAFATYLLAFLTADVICLLAALSMLLLRGRTGPTVPANGPA